VKESRPSRNDLLDAVQTQGLAGLLQVLPRMIDPDGLSLDCLADSEACVGGATTDEDIWGCAVGTARCLNTLPLYEDPPEFEPPPPPPPTPPPDPEMGERTSAAVAALATLLVHLHRQDRTRSKKQ
jgi:hypothetical protein